MCLGGKLLKEEEEVHKNSLKGGSKEDKCDKSKLRCHCKLLEKRV